MSNSKKRLSLNDFKAKAEKSNSHKSLEKLVGGILGACHTYTAEGPVIIVTPHE